LVQFTQVRFKQNFKQTNPTTFRELIQIESYKNLFIRSFIYHKINTFGLPKFSKISFAFNIFVPIPVKEMVYLKVNLEVPNLWYMYS